ncbi:hypothetical protein VTL71DRAFT_4490 [Oculimacula yallundae]|uniref:histone acetyltransferase n=1 Tax=Oculimacula yallundae TaxID=86028 RepID=A0ABR4C3A1_9HELO
MGKERRPSVTAGSRGGGRAGAIQDQRRGRVDVGEGEGEGRGERRRGMDWGWSAPPLNATTTTTSTTTTTHTKNGVHTTIDSTTTRVAPADQHIGGKGRGEIHLKTQGLDTSTTLEVNESRTIKQEDLGHNNAIETRFHTPISATASPRVIIRFNNPSAATASPRPNLNPNPQPHPPQPRLSPEPHPQPKRYRLKFKRHVLEKAQAREEEQRDEIEKLLQRQERDAVCVSTLVRERDLMIMPSLEGPLSLRSGRSRSGRGGDSSGDSGVALERERGKVVNGHGSGHVNGLERERERVVRNAGRRARDKENKLNGDNIHVEEIPLPQQQVNTIITIAETVKPSRPKKMELELRIDDNSHGPDKDKETLERNIENVIFGEVTFKAWYPSWYPKEIIGEKALTVGAGDKGGIVVPELYVCKRCFGYGKVLVEWVRHCRCCEREVPGKKVYVHGGWREDDSPRPAVGEWSIWEVDGGVETLFCQNLSLFAKLFLDNKSVFFDVSGFNYFLLVYTPPQNSPHNLSSPSPSTTTQHKQIIGFFSKEKLSWDNNNLACILIFPPWQRKGLGALLMGVSYAIARREQILGGPEKPISELGRKGYKRFWGAEIARWILERRDVDRRRVKGKKGGGKREQEVVGIRLLSEETWIAPEDCLAVLRDMDVVERVGSGRASSGLDVAGEGDGAEGKRERCKVRIDKEAVRRWCEREKIKLERVVTEEGFSPGYAERVDEVEADVEEGEGEVADGEGDEEMAG